MKKFTFWPHKKKHFYAKKRFIVFTTLVAFILIARIALPSIMLKNWNKFFKNVSPVVEGHIEDFDVSLLRGAYAINGVILKLKKNNHVFLKVDEIDFSIAWRELFRGKVLMDLAADKAQLHISKEILNELKKISASQRNKTKQKTIPLDIERVDLKKSEIVFEDFEGFKKGEHLAFKDINTRVTNITPKKSFPYSYYNLNSKLQGETPIKAAGKLNLLAKPVEWDVDGSLQSFNLITANSILKKNVPLTFTHGEADVFTELKSENGVIQGYIKPFLKNLDVIKHDEDFKGPKHWAVEVVTAISNLILRNNKENSFATRIPVKYGKQLKVDTGEAIDKAIQHGFEESLRPGIENKYELE